MIQAVIVNPQFPVGQIAASAAVFELSSQNDEFKLFVQKCLNRHVRKDWGDIAGNDKVLNDAAVKTGRRLHSAFINELFPRVGSASLWIITEPDRKSTTILFPNDY